MKLLASLLVCLFLGATQADKDDSYYIAGTGNPNVNQKMYWKDAENILQDLSQFSSLHVQFHQCAWTWMEMDDEDNDVEENDYWYMGKIPPMGANVAFSLYGSLKGKNFYGCSKDTFINSFYTNSGFNDFAKAMYYAGVSGFSSFSYADDDASSSTYTADCQASYGVGQGVGCDATNGFALHTYSSTECNPKNAIGVLDTLSGLNQAMANAQCVSIYKSTKSSTAALDLLSNSHACFYQDVMSPDGECPDPYGLLSTYQQSFYDGIQETKQRDPYRVYTATKLYGPKIQRGKNMTYTGLVLFAIASIVFLADKTFSKNTAANQRTLKTRKVRKTRRAVPNGNEFPDDDEMAPPSNSPWQFNMTGSGRKAGRAAPNGKEFLKDSPTESWNSQNEGDSCTFESVSAHPSHEETSNIFGNILLTLGRWTNGITAARRDATVDDVVVVEANVVGSVPQPEQEHDVYLGRTIKFLGEEKNPAPDTAKIDIDDIVESDQNGLASRSFGSFWGNSTKDTGQNNLTTDNAPSAYENDSVDDVLDILGSRSYKSVEMPAPETNATAPADGSNEADAGDAPAFEPEKELLASCSSESVGNIETPAFETKDTAQNDFDADDASLSDDSANDDVSDAPASEPEKELSVGNEEASVPETKDTELNDFAITDDSSPADDSFEAEAGDASPSEPEPEKVLLASCSSESVGNNDASAFETKDTAQNDFDAEDASLSDDSI